MFFRRKNKNKKDTEELRKHYRRVPGKKHALSVRLEREGEKPLTGELIDVSAGGSGVVFGKDSDPGLEEGDRTVLHFHSLVHGGAVVAEAEVVRRVKTGDQIRCGFRFVDPTALFEQLDSFYIRFFNRRRSIRVRPALDRRLRTTLRPLSGTSDVYLHDVSPRGIGFVVNGEQAEAIGKKGSFDVELFIPKHPEPIRWHATIRHWTKLSQGVRIGMEFDVEKTPSGEQRAVVERYCAEREADMARWDTHYE